MYNTSKILVDEVSGEEIVSLWIDEDVTIDYREYNDLITKFINVYNLKKIDSNLELCLYVGVSGDAWGMRDYETPVASLNIPLAANTIAIYPEYNLKDDIDSKILLGVKDVNSAKWARLAVCFFGVDAIVFIGLIIYMLATATERDKYRHKLKNIMNNYGSYISVVEDQIDMEGFKVLKVANFVDLLEIRDTIHMPIIMVENKEQLLTYFAIPSNDILYFFTLGVEQPVLASGQVLEAENSNSFESSSGYEEHTADNTSIDESEVVDDNMKKQDDVTEKLDDKSKVDEEGTDETLRGEDETRV